MGKHILLVVVLLAVGAAAKTKNPDDYDTVFTVMAASTGGASRYCPMTVSTGGAVYEIYSRTWQCTTYPVGTQVGGRFTNGIWLSALPPVHADEIELTYWKKGRLKTLRFVVDSVEAQPHQ
jgi:hypothetical protein